MNSKLFLALSAIDNYRGLREKKMRYQSQMTKLQTYQTQRMKIKNLSVILLREELTSSTNAEIRNHHADIFYAWIVTKMLLATGSGLKNQMNFQEVI